MQKLLISLCAIAILPLLGCSSEERRAETNRPQTSFLEKIPIVYRMDIQQGNIVKQEMVDQLQPGMSKRQVRFHLGTPMLVDPFHLNRWDYAYEYTQGWGETERRHLSLYFENDSLIRIEGAYRPRPEAQQAQDAVETVVEVPDYVDPDRGILTKAVESVSSTWSDVNSTAAESPAEQAMEEARQAKQAAQESNKP